MKKALTVIVAEMIADMGHGTLDDLQPHFPDKTRKQIHDALANAAYRNLIRVKELGKSLGGTLRGRGISVWEAVPNGEPKPKRKGVYQPIRPPASVFELAEDRPRVTWPPRSDGRRFNPLGGWAD